LSQRQRQGSSQPIESRSRGPTLRLLHKRPRASAPSTSCPGRANRRDPIRPSPSSSSAYSIRLPDRRSSAPRRQAGVHADLPRLQPRTLPGSLAARIHTRPFVPLSPSGHTPAPPQAGVRRRDAASWRRWDRRCRSGPPPAHPAHCYANAPAGSARPRGIGANPVPRSLPHAPQHVVLTARVRSLLSRGARHSGEPGVNTA